MPKAKDLTGDLGRLRKRGVFAKGTPAPLLEPPAEERRLALNTVGVLCWVAVAVLLAAQVAFVLWLL